VAVARAVAVPVSVPRLLVLGLLAAALFSTNFVLNRAISLGGGNWVWSAALRYIDTALLLGFWLLLRRGPGYLAIIGAMFWRRRYFWLTAGGIGYGLFYACLCYAANHAPAWITATTYQLTILASPFVLRAFGKRVPIHGIAFLVLIFLGVIIINAQRLLAGIPVGQVLAGVLPTAIAACVYPVGNQLISEAKHAGDADGKILSDPIACVFLMTLGALPVFLALLLVTLPGPPSGSQLISTAIIALLAGCFATTLFTYARNISNDAYRIAAVDATQAGEVGFTLAGEMVFLGTAWPDFLGWIGLTAVVGGLLGFTLWRRGGA
jgi:drug/metabolite transporter (DMT)-like permease